jgi:hypothetical protein
MATATNRRDKASFPPSFLLVIFKSFYLWFFLINFYLYLKSKIPTNWRNHLQFQYAFWSWTKQDVMVIWIGLAINSLPRGGAWNSNWIVLNIYLYRKTRVNTFSNIKKKLKFYFNVLLNQKIILKNIK